MPRKIEEIVLPLAAGIVVMHPEAAVLCWSNFRDRADVGRFCFLRRDISPGRLEDQCFDDLNDERIKAVRRLIEYFSEATELGLRPSTLHARYRDLNRFMNWADERGHCGVLSDKDETEKALGDYGDEQRELASQSQLNRNTVAAAQLNLQKTLCGFFEEGNFGAGIKRLRFSRKHVVPTEVPDEERLALLIAWADGLFTNISSHVLEFKPYPFLIVTSLGETIHVVPQALCASRRDGKRSRGLLAWNLETGEMRSYQELWEQFKARGRKKFRQNAYNVRKTAMGHLEAANKVHSALRREHALTAALAFAALFLAETGINSAQLVAMKWSPDLSKSLSSASVVRQKFRAVKYRAGGKEISFTVSIAFMQKLRTYLELRKYLVQDSPLDALFVARGLGSGDETVALTSEFLVQFYVRLEVFGVTLPRVTARQLRAAKQDWAMSNHDPAVAAELMGTTLETAIRAYSNGTASAQRAEFGALFASIEKTILGAEEPLPPGSIRGALGACVHFQHPEPISPEAPVKPDCKSSEGCLFCDKYKAHADETDVRKLLSCRHCLRLTGQHAHDVEQYERTFGPVLRRVDFLLEEVRKRDSALVVRIENDVDMGNLDPFWASKLEMLIELGIA
ncbi:integrase [Paraburkholderia strydomiana]|uniref:Integrase n=1 Tax=Paraburkholderia strydomiana TaxID=1245417 RepID=A0ABW9BX73_9BURK